MEWFPFEVCEKSRDIFTRKFVIDDANCNSLMKLMMSTLFPALLSQHFSLLLFAVFAVFPSDFFPAPPFLNALNGTPLHTLSVFQFIAYFTKNLLYLYWFLLLLLLLLLYILVHFKKVLSVFFYIFMLCKVCLGFSCDGSQTGSRWWENVRIYA